MLSAIVNLTYCMLELDLLDDVGMFVDYVSFIRCVDGVLLFDSSIRILPKILDLVCVNIHSSQLLWVVCISSTTIFLKDGICFVC